MKRKKGGWKRKTAECPDCGITFSWEAHAERSSGDHGLSLSCPGCGSILDGMRSRPAGR